MFPNPMDLPYQVMALPIMLFIMWAPMKVIDVVSRRYKRD